MTRVTWNETTFDADAIHIAMIYEISRLIHVNAARNAENAQWRAVAEASARVCEKLRSACHLTLAIAEDRSPGTWDDVMLLMRAALAPEEPPE